MANFQLAYNATTLTATVQTKGDALPAGSTKLVEFKHDDAQDALGNTAGNTVTENHVFFHHVRDALYHVGQQDMSIVTITLDIDYKALTAFTIVQGNAVAVATNANVQLTHVFTPADASNKKLTYVSATPAKATVSNTGLVHGVAAGTSVITVTSEDGAIVHTTTVTVS